MRLTTKGRFAVTAMIDLGLRQSNGPVTLAAIKAEDGATRAAETVLLAMLDRLQPLDDAARSTLATFIRPTLVNHAGTQVGHIAMAPGWPAP